MAKDPILPLYYNDITRSTITWTDEEFGAYMRLLIEQWDKGCLPNDVSRLSRIATSLNNTWELIKSKFRPTDCGLQNPVMEEIRLKRLKHKNYQRENGKLGGRPKKANQNLNNNLGESQTKPKPKPTEKPLESENEIYITTNSNISNTTASKPSFEDFWDLYDKKVDRKTCELKWKKLSQVDKEKIMENLPLYIVATPEKQFRKNPETYLFNRSWENEIVLDNKSSQKTEVVSSPMTREEVDSLFGDK